MRQARQGRSSSQRSTVFEWEERYYRGIRTWRKPRRFGCERLPKADFIILNLDSEVMNDGQDSLFEQI